MFGIHFMYVFFLLILFYDERSGTTNMQNIGNIEFDIQ